jgi:hypothetical protein
LVAARGGRPVAQTGPDERAALVSELAKVVEIIEDPEQRKAFAADTEGTLEIAGVNLEVIPGEVRDTLAGLSYEQLGLLSDIGKSFVGAGLVLGELPRGMRVWFF